MLSSTGRATSLDKSPFHLVSALKVECEVGRMLTSDNFQKGWGAKAFQGQLAQTAWHRTCSH